MVKIITAQGQEIWADYDMSVSAWRVYIDEARSRLIGYGETLKHVTTLARECLASSSLSSR